MIDFKELEIYKTNRGLHYTTNGDGLPVFLGRAADSAAKREFLAGELAEQLDNFAADYDEDEDEGVTFEEHMAACVRAWLTRQSDARAPENLLRYQSADEAEAAAAEINEFYGAALVHVQTSVPGAYKAWVCFIEN
jgi:hypothetical protein